MNCQEINGQLGALLDQALEPPQATTVQRHLTHCVECQIELARLRALRTALQSVEPPLASASLDERVLAAFRRRHERTHVTGKAGGWRAWFFGSLSLPKPALALMGVLLVATAALAYKAGEIMGMRLPEIKSPVWVYNQTAPPKTIGEPVRSFYVTTPGKCARSNFPQRSFAQTNLAKAADARPATLQFETRAYASEAGIDYTTNAALENFEPVKDPSVRVIKGGNQ